MMRGQEHLCYEDRELGLFSLERRLPDRPFQYVKELIKIIESNFQRG